MIISLTGLSCSGKTSISSYIFDECKNFRIMNIHDLLKYESQKKGYRKVREWMFDIGFEQFREKMNLIAINYILLNIKYPILIEDLFDYNLYSQIKLLEKDNYIIYIKSSYEIRLRRVLNRLDSNSDSAINEISFLDEFKQKTEIKKIMDLADINIENNNRNILDVKSDVIMFIDNLMRRCNI